MKHMIVMCMCLLALSLGAGPALINPSPAPKSEAGIDAVYKYNQAMLHAYDEWRQSKIKAERQLSGDLGASLRIALRAEQADEAAILYGLHKESEARLDRIINLPSALVGDSGTTVWQYGEPNDEYGSGLINYFHGDGTVTTCALMSRMK